MSMRERGGEVHTLEDTPFGYTMKVISGKWKMVIMYLLAEQQPVRFNEMQRFIGTITYKTLSLQLKELERDGGIPQRVYADSAKGRVLSDGERNVINSDFGRTLLLGSRPSE